MKVTTHRSDSTTNRKIGQALERSVKSVTWAEILALANQLGDISYSDWKKLCTVMESAFKKKKGELERELKLSDEEKKDAILQLFGYVPD